MWHAAGSKAPLPSNGVAATGGAARNSDPPYDSSLYFDPNNLCGTTKVFICLIFCVISVQNLGFEHSFCTRPLVPKGAFHHVQAFIKSSINEGWHVSVANDSRELVVFNTNMATPSKIS